MHHWLIDSRDQFQSEIFDFLWQQWNTLGLAGVSEANDKRIIDPETLLLFSLSVCRFEPRLFDEILDWLHKNGHFINVQRLKQIQRKYCFACDSQLNAVAQFLAKNAKYKLKWSGLIGKHITHPPEPLFYDNQGAPLPLPADQDTCPEFLAHGLKRGSIRLRGKSKSFDPQNAACLLLRLRALIGMHARAEILCLLASVDTLRPTEAARQTCYYQKTIQTALLEMAQSGAVWVRTEAKAKHYSLTPGILDSLLTPNHHPTHWLHWPSILKAIETVWLRLRELSQQNYEPLLLASELHQILVKAGKQNYDASLHEINFNQ
ncbi:hypothetical protein ACFL6U_31290, partial [Planctomycetota bacterium]